ncbi:MULTISPECIES: MOP flippase family protein [Sphingobacterium]|uniref:MOP flippase family protein n=1 Tax=Sphingobacterium TaxID=28453 RepID=UPI00129C21BE|nr:MULTISPECIES: MOP flippase family protein [Sphingobacterium]
MDFKKSVIKGVKWTSFSTIILAVVAIAKISILTRYLNKSDFGLIAMITFILNFMDLFNDMGISTAILHKQNISKKEYSSLYWSNLGLSIFLYIAVLLATPLIVDFYNQPQLSIITPLLALNLIFTGIGRQFKVILQKELNFKLLAIADISSALISIILAVYLAIKGFGVFSLVYSTILQMFLSNCTFVVLGFSKHKISFYCNLALIKDFFRIGMYQVGGQVANYFNRDLDILIIGKLFNAQVLGGYSLAKQLVFRPFQLINPVIIKVASPVLAKSQNDPESLKINYLKLLNSVSSLNILIYVLLILFSNQAIEILYGKDYLNVSILVKILSVYMIFRAIGNPVGSLVVATGRTDLDFKWNLLTLAVIPLAVFTGSRWGIEFVALSLTISMMILFYPSWKYLINKMTIISFKEYIKAAFLVSFKFK